MEDDFDDDAVGMPDDDLTGGGDLGDLDLEGEEGGDVELDLEGGEPAGRPGRRGACAREGAQASTGDETGAGCCETGQGCAPEGCQEGCAQESGQESGAEKGREKDPEKGCEKTREEVGEEGRSEEDGEEKSWKEEDPPLNPCGA